MRVAVVGAGVAGIVASWEISRKHEVTLFEKRSRLGGHTHTWLLDEGPDAGTAIDSGFIVCNNKTYPNFHRFLAELGVRVRWADMSFGFHDEGSGLQYAGSSLDALFADRMNLLNPRFLRMLMDIRRFCRQALKDLEERPAELARMTLAAYLKKHRINRATVEDYLVPMGAAIWSTPANKMLRFPALAYIRFFRNHGLLSLKDRPRWQTVAGGSHSYLMAFAEHFQGEIRLDSRIDTIKRNNNGITIRHHDGHEEQFDRVVLAVHADQVLPLLEEPTKREDRLFSTWKYESNIVVLHSDESVMPPNRRAWASWNYTREQGADKSAPLSMTYWMDNLMGLKTRRNYFVTLNRQGDIDPAMIVREFVYAHPIYTRKSIATQKHLPALNGTRNTWYCGSYFFNGFHEDATRAALLAAGDFR
ncbi:MAG: FAD-dependent oxidoreductase [Candidatus Sumerlaeia bacterium]|nr:FAD-dependent oxidoreductase [Candidatus Sumerlaeia bacterium]